MVEETSSLDLPEAFPASATLDRNVVSVAKGGGITFAGQIFLAASRFVLAVLMARLLGAKQYGLYSLTISVGAIAGGLALLGLDAALVRYVAIAAGRRDETRLWGALQVCMGLSLFASVVISTGLFALAYPIAEQTFGDPQLAPLLQLMSVIVPFLTLSDMLAGAHRGFKRMDYPALAQSVVQPMVRLVLVLVLALVGLNAALAVIIYGVADASASVVMLYYLNKQFRLKRPLRAAKREPRVILGFSVPIMLSDMMLRVRDNVQILLLGRLGTATSVGIFSVASQLNMFGGLFSSSINTSAKPVVAELHDRGDRQQLGHLYQTAAKWSLMTQLPMFLIIVLFSEQILSLFGKSFTDGATALVILACADLVNVGTGMGGTIIDMTGHTRLKLFNSIQRLILYVVLDLLLIPRWGLVGAATVVLITEFIINLLRLLEVYFLFRLWPYNRSALKPVAAAAAALAGALIVNRWFPADAGLIFLGINVAAVFAIYVGVTLLLGLSAEDRLMLSRFYQRARRILPGR